MEVLEAYQVVCDNEKRKKHDKHGEKAFQSRFSDGGGGRGSGYTWAEYQRTSAQSSGFRSPFEAFFSSDKPGEGASNFPSYEDVDNLSDSFGFRGSRFGDYDSASRHSSSTGSANQGQSKQKSQDPPIEHDLYVTLEELYKGCKKSMKITRNITEIDGKTKQESKVLIVNVKPGCESGTSTFEGEGDRDSRRNPVDVVFIIRDKSHPLFKRARAEAILQILFIDLRRINEWHASLRMKDRRGVDRGSCRECGESECAEYELPPDENKNECGYCFCAPVKHIKKETSQIFQSSGTFHHDIPEDEKTVELNPTGNISDENGKTLSDPVLAMVSALNDQSTGPDSTDATQEDLLSDHHVSFNPSAGVDPTLSPLCPPPVPQDTFCQSPVTTFHKNDIKEMVQRVGSDGVSEYSAESEPIHTSPHQTNRLVAEVLPVSPLARTGELKGKYLELLVWALQNIDVKDCGLYHPLVDFKAPFIGFIRVGNLRNNLSKSKVINEALFEKHDAFFHADLNLGEARRQISNGVIEMALAKIHLSPGKEIKESYESESLKPAFILNLRGDAAIYPTQVQLLGNICSFVILFLGKETTPSIGGGDHALSEVVSHLVRTNGTKGARCTVLKDKTHTSLNITHVKSSNQNVKFVNLQKTNRPLKAVRDEVLHIEEQRGISKTLLEFEKSLGRRPAEQIRNCLFYLGMKLNSLSTEALNPLRVQWEKNWEFLNISGKDDDMEERKKKKMQLAEVERKMLESSLGIENIFREFAQIYECLIETPNKNNVSGLPGTMASLILDGLTLELLDGDNGYIPLKWLKAIFDKMRWRVGKIWVLSVIGIQSSGKSTMLNTIFGSDFLARTGRCTKGVYMQFFPFGDENEGCDSPRDYLVLLDTEGLRSPEFSDDYSGRRDNELASFAIGMADLTLLNVMGETPSDVKELLPTVLHGFIRMGEVKLEPQVAIIHQNVQADAHRSRKQGLKKMQEVLDEMTVVAAKEEDLFPKISRFHDVIKLNLTKDTHYFPPLFQAGTLSIHSEKYGCKAKQMKTVILDKLRSCNGRDLNLFSRHMEQLWGAIMKENFAFSFRNVMEMAAYNDVESILHALVHEADGQLMERWDKWKGEIMAASNETKIQDVCQKGKKELDSLTEKVSEEKIAELNEKINSSERKDLCEMWRGRSTSQLRSQIDAKRDQIRQLFLAKGRQQSAIFHVENQVSKLIMKMEKQIEEHGKDESGAFDMEARRKERFEELAEMCLKKLDIKSMAEAYAKDDCMKYVLHQIYELAKRAAEKEDRPGLMAVKVLMYACRESIPHLLQSQKKEQAKVEKKLIELKEQFRDKINAQSDSAKLKWTAKCVLQSIWKSFHASALLHAKRRFFDFLGKQRFFKNKKAFTGYCMLRLIREDDYETTMEFVRSPGEWKKNYLKEMSCEFLEVNRQREFFDSTKMMKEFCHETIESFLKFLDEPGLNSVHLDRFIEMINVRLKLAHPIKLQSIVRSSCSIIYNSNEFIQNLRNFVAEKKGDILEFEQVDLLSDDEESPIRRLQKNLLGCLNRCPFCGTECEQTFENHIQREQSNSVTLHGTEIHIPQCMGRYRWLKTEEMVLETCPESVGSETSFRTSDEEEWTPFKKYKTKYPDWDIPPKEQDNSPLFWKRFIGRHSDALAKTYGMKVSSQLPPAWKQYTTEEVRANLRDLYFLHDEDEK
ncbi:unnamed protein product [Darwinula stevensoni]|uniref:VLIG-type G domain-containing protein n=1 Tax=Darwinula stevensoni TaxID=69355 RepID=A0A7R9ABR2_9CRUS|nr:unnamed protein product [Darwinula stevensoni]CAG0899164.1 unnamed protein product [Darwinula stevensoni]